VGQAGGNSLFAVVAVIHSSLRAGSLDNQSNTKHLVAVIGAGPAGLFATKQLAAHGIHVVLFNRDIKPGGLAEYGIFPSKHKMKERLRKQFRQIFQLPEVDYFGNVVIGQMGDLTLGELRAYGFQALVVCAGAQGTKWLGLPGEDLVGVYHAKDLVYHYNLLPPFSEKKYAIGKRVAVIGVGNVMLDIAHWLIRYAKVDEVIAIARRGPAEVKFTKKELESVARNLDLADLEAEFDRVGPVMQAAGQDIEAAKAYFHSALPKALDPVSKTRFRFEFLASPSRILGGERGVVRGLEIEDTTLVPSDGGTYAKRLGTKRVIDADTVIFCIGDRVDETFGLPVRKNEFVKNPNPRYPVDGISFEAYDPDLDRPIERVFVAGWSREASSGLVGVARKDGEMVTRAVLQLLESLPSLRNTSMVLEDLQHRLDQINKPVITTPDLLKLEEIERCEAERRGLEEFKFSSNLEMLKALGLA
jgi:ferredoxin/flavodoxin---NADP+ reductase